MKTVANENGVRKYTTNWACRFAPAYFRISACFLIQRTALRPGATHVARKLICRVHIFNYVSSKPRISEVGNHKPIRPRW